MYNNIRLRNAAGGTMKLINEQNVACCMTVVCSSVSELCVFLFDLTLDYATDLGTVRNSLKVNEIVSRVLCCSAIGVKEDFVI